MGKTDKLQKTAGTKRYWRSLDELEGTEAYTKWLGDEFPDRSSIPNIDRRDMLKLMGAATVMASLAGCRSLPQEKIIPYVIQPEDTVPGVTEHYSTAFTLGGYAHGILAESRSGRPGKLEGHPNCSSTIGSSDVWIQGSLYDMYDPDRSQSVRKGKLISSWDEFRNEILGVLRSSEGNRIHILTENITSPSLKGQLKAFLNRYPGSQWHQWEPVNADNVYAGTQIAFGQAVRPVYSFENADVIVSLDDDLFSFGPGRIRYAHDIAAGRIVEEGTTKMNRIYAVHCAATITSAYADHRLAVKPSQVEKVAKDLATAVEGGSPGGDHAKWIEAVAGDLRASGGRCVVTAGWHQPPAVHAIAHAFNSLLGAVGKTVSYHARLDDEPQSLMSSLDDLVATINADAVDVLFILGGNPVYNAPGSAQFAESLNKVKTIVHCGLFVDETAELANWHLPEAHFLESWGDAMSFDGTIRFQQPLVAPLYSGRSLAEVLELLGRGTRTGKQILRDTYAGNLGAGLAADAAWDKMLHDGVGPKVSTLVGVAASTSVIQASNPQPAKDLELLILPDPTIYDGRFANNAWLQEIPKPMTSATWDNTVQLSPATARSLGIEFEDIVEIATPDATVRGPAMIVPGQADGTVVVHMGYGRRAGGKIMLATSPDLPKTNKMYGAPTVGFDVFPLVGPTSFAASVQVTKVGGKWAIAQTQTHFSMEGRDIVRSGTFDELASNPSLSHHESHGEPDTLYNQTAIDKVGQQEWAMTIDLGLCTGCNACTIACQAENNIPTVGKEQVARGREMHWIRIDRYNLGAPESPDETVFQPVACLMCERAPCEPVCPVAATVHSKEGLNQMVYNRCVGTRYCSNNCPYKVRRFNFINYNDKVDKPSITLLNNPDVTVRGRGVMEKCTYCVQRINKARILEKRKNKATDEPNVKVPEGKIVTACQQACPTNAIVFGDQGMKDSKVAKMKANPRAYGLLAEEVNTAPRTSYLGRVRNANPALGPTSATTSTGSEGH